MAEELTNVRMANEKSIKKRNRSTRQIPCEGGLTVEEALQPTEQVNQPVEEDRVDSHAEVELPSQPLGR